MLPIEVAYLQGSASNGAVYDSASRAILWNGPVAQGAGQVVTFAVSLAPGLTDNTVITNVVSLSDPVGAQLPAFGGHALPFGRSHGLT